MTRNPILNALGAVGYIIIFGALAQYVFPNAPFPDNEFAGMILFLSMFVFSVGVMGYTLILAPFQLLVEGDKKGAVSLFLKTMLAFIGFGVVAAFAATFLPAPPPSVGD